jgi:DNA ligase (NAD+)
MKLKIAKSVLEFLKMKKINHWQIEEFRLQFEIIENINPNATDKLAGKVFVVSGVFNSSRETNWKKQLKKMEGK